MSSTTSIPFRSALLWVVAIIATVAVAGWFAVSCSPGGSQAERPVSEEEAALLAGMREKNHDAAPVALRMSLPVDGETLTVDGYLDWQVPMAYARVPDGEGGFRLVQAVPGLIASRADDEAAFGEVRVPEDGWTTRAMLSGAGTQLETTLDILVSSLFTLTAEQADDPAALAEAATWREEGVIDGESVDSFRAPIMVETDAQAGEAAGAAPEALYSLDGEGNLRRFQVNTGAEALSAVDFLRDVSFDAAGLVPNDMLGGARIAPEPVDEDLAETLAELRAENWSESAEVEMAVPVADGQAATGFGSVDWRSMTAYLHVTDASGQRLLLARPGGFATLAVEDGELPETPPTEGWEVHELAGEDTAESFGPVESLVYRLLEMAAEEGDDEDVIAERASLLRVDGTEEDPVYVVEFPVNGDAEAEPGRSAYRYHVADDRLSEVEMMTYYGVASAEVAYEDYPMVPVPAGVEERIG
ncbi:hypothetical protein SAMN05216298_0390 [Glycomyces sambucus]|uniref:Uncharacterized protein n=1 Tax=Glycomyces sambucus TaxID=380244 RepID=A0A1G9CKJ5_9ACTN|nr:hypothetical protein [Glycomyces sambucus]SDK52211.1 hypothetical protein SAMN05216298_0390 [Glycomyces sambucus]